MDQQRQTQSGLSRHTEKVTGVLLLAMLWGSTALAATDSIVECDEIAKSLQSLEIASADSVEHLPDTDATVSGALEAEPDVNDVSSPILDLTPRVAAILRDVFGQDGDIGDSQLLENPAVRFSEPTVTLPSSPIAGSANGPDLAESVDAERQVDIAEQDRNVPRIRRMFRTDI